MANETQCIIPNTLHSVTQFTIEHSSYGNPGKCPLSVFCLIGVQRQAPTCLLFMAVNIGGFSGRCGKSKYQGGIGAKSGITRT